jgi:hypothetical protein
MKSSIKFIIKNKSGMALPSVLIICTLLVMMLVPLLNLSLQQLEVSKSQSNVGYSYLASGTATEKAVKSIKDYIDRKTYISYYDVDPNAYADKIISDRNIGSMWGDMEAAVNVETDVGSSNNGKSKLKSLFRVGNVSTNASGDKYVVTVGFVITSNIVKGKNSASGTDIYSQVVFEIDMKKSFFRPAAINGIGDIYVTGNMNANINGDVKVVGTAPEAATQPQQDRYGGIYATQNGNLTISGNAFARAFIRCGDTSQTAYDDYIIDPINRPGDNSMIEIKKSAVAQCLQIFGPKDYILVHNDAYTFDDIEMNGLNSIIAVNRSFFGLSNVTGSSNEFHDASSAIVNSAIVHYPDEQSLQEAMKSKIIINGNVMINGGTFWINPDNGKPLNDDEPQLEDASSAWNDDDELPTYKNFEYVSPDSRPSGYLEFHIKSGVNTADVQYRTKSWLYDQYTKGLANGYSNLIQAWIPRESGYVSTWFNTIKSLNANYENVKTRSFPLGFNPSPYFIRGFCHFEVAANGTMYFMDKYGKTRLDTFIEEANTSWLGISKGEIKNSLYYLDANLNKFGVAQNDFDTWWDNNWNYPNYEGYMMSVGDAMKEIKPKLEKITEDFVDREYDYRHGKILNSPVKEVMTNSNFFNYIGSKLKDCNSGASDEIIIDSEITSTVPQIGGVYQISNYLRGLDSTIDKSKFFVVVVNDPNNTIEINSEINAIVYTRGKVIMSPGGKLNGFIIAAGKGYNGGASTTGSAADLMPYIKSDGSNIALLDSGEFASVVFRGAGTATVNFELNTGNIDKNSDGIIDQQDNLQVLIDKYNGTLKATLSELFNS